MANVPFPEIEMSVPALMMVSLPSGATPEGSVIVPPPLLKVMSFPVMDIVWNSLVESVSPKFEITFPVISIPLPALYVLIGKVTESPVRLSKSVLPLIDKFCNSLVVLLSASSTPSFACATQSVPFHVSTSLVFPEGGSSISLLGSLSASSTSSFSTLKACKA